MQITLLLLIFLDKLPNGTQMILLQRWCENGTKLMINYRFFFFAGLEKSKESSSFSLTAKCEVMKIQEIWYFSYVWQVCLVLKNQYTCIGRQYCIWYDHLIISDTYDMIMILIEYSRYISFSLSHWLEMFEFPLNNTCISYKLLPT